MGQGRASTWSHTTRRLREAHVYHAWRQLRMSPQYRRARLQTMARLARWGAHCLTGHPVVVTLRQWGCRICLPPGVRLGSTAIFLFREDYEPELRYLERFLSPGDTFIDVGASVGLYTVVASTLVGARGRVLAFEPASEIYPVLRRNAAINGTSNVTTFNAAVSDQPGTARLFHITGASLYSLGERAGHDDSFEEVRVTTLDEVVDRMGLDSVACIKIDVEGAEALVLRGASRTLARFRPTVLFEANSYAASRFDGGGPGPVELLSRLGYRFEVAGPDGPVPMTSLPDAANVVAVPPLG